IKQSLQNADATDFVKYLHSPSTMKAAVTLSLKSGQRSLISFVRNKGNARYSMPVILASVAYLGWEMSCGALIHPQDSSDPNETLTQADLGCDNKGLNPQVSVQIAKKFATAFGDAATGGQWIEEPPDDEDDRLTLNGSGHGAMFHMVQAAYFQLKHRYANGEPIKFLEKQRWVTIQNQAELEGAGTIRSLCKKTSDSGCFAAYQRNVDIILG